MINNELGMSSLLNVNVDIDIKDSNKYIYNVYGSTYLLNKTYFDDAYASVQALFMQYIKEIYALNEDGRDATEDISEVLKLCKSIADVSVDSRQVTPDMTYNMLSLDQIKELYSNIDIERYIKETGREKLETACVNDIEQAKFVNSLITQDNLELLKKYTKTCLYILTAIWTFFLRRAGFGNILIVVNNLVPLAMGLFTGWFVKWYPAWKARG